MEGYPTQADIDEMKKRGYERPTIAEAEARRERGAAARQLCEVIRQAFDGVRLGDGVGLSEARAIDDLWADRSALAAYRAKDEKYDWQAISAETLDRYNDTLNFLDAEGMRFHLPAFLIANLQGRDRCSGVEYVLTRLGEHNEVLFTLFSAAQRRAVRAFLRHLCDDPNHILEQKAILRALDEYWTGPD